MQPSASESIPENTPLPLPAQPAAAGVDAAPLGSESADRNGAVTSSVPPSANKRTSTSPPTFVKYVKVIEPPSGWPSLNLAEVWQYRDLLLLLIWRDISANYRQSVIGYGWALFRSISQTAVGSLVFSVIAGLESKPGIPYPLLIFVGLLPWMYFSTSLIGASGSVVSSSGLLTKVYFPRLILPLSSLGSGLVDFGIQFVLLLVVLPFFVGIPGWTILLVPVFLAACMLAALSVSLWLTALNVKYRDIGHMVSFLVQIWMWLTPVYYLSEKLSSHLGNWGWLFGLNPMTGVVEGFRWAMLGSADGIDPPDWSMMAVSFTVVALLLVSGLYYFRRVERTWADVI
jgi:lipopolysaccharide transport system permease protein